MREEKKRILTALEDLNACDEGLNRVRASRDQSWRAIWDKHTDWSDMVWLLGQMTATKRDRIKLCLCGIDLAYTAFSDLLFSPTGPAKYLYVLELVRKYVRGIAPDPREDINGLDMMDASFTPEVSRLKDMMGEIRYAATHDLRQGMDLVPVFLFRHIEREFLSHGPSMNAVGVLICNHIRSWFPEAPDIFTK